MNANPNPRQIDGHIEAWIDAYLDGELSPSAASKIEIHLESCPGCLALLKSRQGLSGLLQSAPLPEEFKSVDRFAADVRLQLRARPARRRGLGWEWYALPLALLLGVAFFQAVRIVNAMVGLFSTIQEPLSGLVIENALNRLVELPAGLDLLSVRFPSLLLPGWSWLSGLIALVFFGLLYIAWLAGWLSYTARREIASSH